MVRQARGGFSMIELLVVLAVIAGLIGLTYPIVSAVMERGRRDRTESILPALHAAMATYGRAFVPVPNDRTRSLWDFNSDGFVDGDPERDPDFTSGDRDAARAVGYRGPAAQLNMSVPRSLVDRKTGRVTDGWGRPLRIAFAAMVYGSSGFGIRSDGADRRPDTKDDVTSWGATQ